jgi:hypothetical protein
MLPFQQDQLERFLRESQPAVAELLEQAYEEAGGHYAAMASEERRRQANIDVGEYVEALIRGGVDREVVQSASHAVTANGIDINDILRMSNALERLVTLFFQAQLPQQPDVAQELIRRARNVAASFRANLVAARMDDSLRRLRPDAS